MLFYYICKREYLLCADLIIFLFKKPPCLKNQLLARMLIFTALLCMLCAGAVYAQGDQVKITVKLNESGSSTTGAWLHLPDDYNSTSEQYPLLIFFHGVGEGGTNLNAVLTHGVPKMIGQGAKMQYTVNGKLFKFIVVSPQAPNGWMETDNVNSVLEDIKARYRVDADRVYLTGLSAGGFAVWNYLVAGTQYSNNIAAVVPVSAAPVNAAKLGGLCNIAASNIATWNLCGDQDSFLQYFTDYTARIRNCNPAIAPKTTLYPGMGHSGALWDRAYNTANTYNTPNIYEWMLQYKRNSTPSTNKPPISNAGSGITITLPVTTAALDGSASGDPDGNIAKYQWAQASGPATAAIASNTSAKTNISGLTVAGSYVFELTVTDDKQATASGRVTITVLAAANTAPVANAGNGSIITLPVTTAALDGSASRDADGSITKYQWAQISGPVTSAIASNASAKTNISGLTATGNYIFELTITDDKQATASARVTVQVLPGVNVSPVANAGNNVTIVLPASTSTLDGSASKDPDGNITKYQWTEISGPATAAIISNTSAKTNISGLSVAGDYIFELTVTDDKQATSKARVTVQVLIATNIAPIANAGSSIAITLPADTAALDGSASRDTDGNIVKYQWVQISGPAQVTIAANASVKTNISGLTAVGNYVFELTVIDEKQASSKARVNVQVLEANNLPPVANAGSSFSINLPVTTATLDGSASKDPDGTIISLQWSQRAGPVTAVIANKNSIRTDIGGLTIAGKYVFLITVADDKLALDTAQMTIEVLSSSNIAPVADAGSNFAITLPATTALLDGSASKDDDGAIAQFQWKQISGPVNASIDAAGSAKTGISNLTAAGDYIFELVVTDNQQAVSNSARITVKVNPLANRGPVARAGNDQALTLPLSGTALDGSYSTDADGSITGYRWKQLSGPVTAVIASNTAAYTDISRLDSAGNYVFELTVTDNRQASATDQVTITVYSDPSTRPGPPPVAHAGQDITIVLPQRNVSLDGSASTDGSIYQWKQISGPANAGIDQAGSAKTTVSGLIIAGNYVFELTVSNNKNESASDRVTVIVKEAPNLLPVADAGADIEITLPVKEASLNGGSTYDDDGFIASYSWRMISGPEAAAILRAGTVTPDVVVEKTGVYTFELVVTDNNGAIDKDTMQLTVQLPDAPENGIEIKLYPNPAVTFIRLETRTKSPKALKVFLFNVDGVMQRRYDVPDPSFWQKDIDLNNLPAGAYFLKITDNKEVNILKRFIKVGG